MGNGALPHGPSYRVHPRLYQSGVSLRVTALVASLIGRLGQALSGYPPLQCRCRSRARASLRTRHQGPSIMGIRRRGGTIYWAALPSMWRQVQATKRTHLIHRPARDIIPPLGGARFPPIAFDPAKLSSHCDFPGPPERSAVNPHAVHDHGQATRQRHDRLLHPAMPGDLHCPGLEPGPFRRTHQHALLGDLAVNVTAGSSGHTNSPHPSSREGHHSTVGWSSISSYCIGILHRSQAAATSLVHRNSVPSTHTRCMITANRRASATIAFFIPRCLATFIAQALSQDHFVERASMLWAAS